MEPRRFSLLEGGGNDQLPKPRLLREVKRAEELTLERQRPPPCPPRRDAAAPQPRSPEPCSRYSPGRRRPLMGAAPRPTAAREPPARRRQEASPFHQRNRKGKEREREREKGAALPSRGK